MQKGFVKLGLLIAIIATFALGIFALNQTVFATGDHKVWDISYGEWSECVPNEGNECGENGGTKTRTVTKTCKEVDGQGEDQCKIEYSCPDGFSPFGHTCRKEIKTTTYDCDVFANIHGDNRNLEDFYNKPTGDDKHCHRIVWDDLSSTKQNQFKSWHDWDYNHSSPNHGSWVSAYNFHVDQNPLADEDVDTDYEYANKIATPEVVVTQETEDCEIPEEQVIACEDTRTHVCDDPEATNYDSEIDDESEVADKNVCEYPDTTPTPTPNDQPKEETKAHASVSAPVCPDGTTTQLPANPHVIRDGSKAIVNWFQTEGDSANVYYKEVNASGWQHSVNDIKVDNADKFGQVTINDLDPNLGYTFGIQQKKGCGGGQTVTAVIIDGPAPSLFYLSYWEWAN